MNREVTDEMIRVFGEAWHAADDQGTHVPGARRRAGLRAVLDLIAREDWPEPHDDPARINLLGRTIGYVRIDNVLRAEYEQAKAEVRLDHEFDAWLSDMDETTVIIEPDGTEVSPYA